MLTALPKPAASVCPQVILKSLHRDAAVFVERQQSGGDPVHPSARPHAAQYVLNLHLPASRGD